MKDIQEIFDRIQEKKQKQKELKMSYKDALETTPGYKEAVENLQTARAKKKELELSVQEDFSSEFQQLEDIKDDIDTDNQMLSDLALTTIMKGEPIEITDKYESNYEPVFSVKFKKMN
ncbi:hypothetical protein A2223_03600 [Candidatus Falkowbacteria bacterium RIFOXYA2_FULL_35_8]|uniref:Uncharacterized protein n=1 Tax=Candidatus Falkowbacteria bacterium RIFOXYC2_FULL_36_12 TaxID=1798002 RepID=A0A1F5SWB7_9BACT|nr:MAG: hypothetical protein A2478_00465 [Candidatus Falkowbacteria bacterium RIFOXYC2_FULL_36_12]OGF31367.1 MAG: hypothetical protein A2300_00990 [Candidatus Falkowbacteria bacterium RIFOXYB2_FULL_35_7]OGF33610.1 MAG: hypothetical protein A2223_03600 [Candidatus Falkowbacteria bacterium RIFOXYA2_FULL_35_8]